MTFPSKPANDLTEVSIDALVSGLPLPYEDRQAECSLFSIGLQEGLDLLLWQGDLHHPLNMQLRDDWGRMNFSCALYGESRYCLTGQTAEREYRLSPGSGCINYTPDCRGRSLHGGKFATLTVSIRPDLLQQWLPQIDDRINDNMGTGGYCMPYDCNAEMRATAQTLSHAINMLRLQSPTSLTRSPLWLTGQSLVMIGLALEGCHRDQYAPTPLHHADHQKLLRARDLLLADLTQAPTIAMLSKESGLSVLKLKRGFRELFGNSIYGLFQAERMQEARRRLERGDRSVMVIASDLGYANASHFTTAFQKQFGVTPSALKRGR